jgi:hypothetical protein
MSNNNSENENDSTIVEHDLIRLRAYLGDSEAQEVAAEFGRPVGESLDLDRNQIKEHLKTLRAYLFDDMALPEGFPKNAEKSLKRHFDRLDEDEKNSFKDVLDHVIDYTYPNNDSNNNWGGGSRRRRGSRRHTRRRSTRHRVARRSRRARKN